MDVRPNSLLSELVQTPTPACESWSDDEKSDVPKHETKLIPTSPSKTPSRIPGLSQSQIAAFYDELYAFRGSRAPTRHKHFDNYTTVTTMSPTITTPATSMFDLAQGTSSNGSRQGQQVRVKKISLRITIKWTNTAVSPGASVDQTGTLYPVRLVVYVDRFPAIAGPTWAEDASPPVGNNAIMNCLGAGVAFNMTAVPNVNTHGVRYRILYDRIINPEHQVYSFNGTQVALTCIRTVEFHHDCDFLTSWYNTTSTSQISNNIGFHIMPDNLPGAGTTQQYPTYRPMWTIMFEEVEAL